MLFSCDTFFCIFIVNLCSKQCADRRTKLTEEVKNIVAPVADSVVTQSDLRAVVSKYRLRCVKHEKSKSPKRFQNKGQWEVLKKNRFKVKWVYIIGTQLQFRFHGSEGDFTVI